MHDANSVSGSTWIDLSGHGNDANIYGSGFTVFNDNSDPFMNYI